MPLLACGTLLLETLDGGEARAGVTHYFSTFITGFDDVVSEALSRQLRGLRRDLLLDGLVTYHAPASAEQVRQLRFLNNSFVLLQQLRSKSKDPVREIVAGVLDNPRLEALVGAHLPTRPVTFRIITSHENQLVATDRTLLGHLEARLARLTRLRPNRSRPDLEFWCLARSEGYGFFGLRLTRHTDYAKTLQKGELRPELAHLLCLLSEPDSHDIFLDPFAGSGSIPLERARAFPYAKIIAGDRDRAALRRLQERTRRLRSPVLVLPLDGANLHQLERGSIDKIVTDPPWGSFGGGDSDLPRLYAAMLDEFYRVVRPGGLIVVLTARKELFERLCEEAGERFVPLSYHGILVSGKKAGVYTLRRSA